MKYFFPEDLNEIKQHLSMTTTPPTVIATAANGFVGKAYVRKHGCKLFYLDWGMFCGFF